MKGAVAMGGEPGRGPLPVGFRSQDVDEQGPRGEDHGRGPIGARGIAIGIAAMAVVVTASNVSSGNARCSAFPRKQAMREANPRPSIFAAPTRSMAKFKSIATTRPRGPMRPSSNRARSPVPAPRSRARPSVWTGTWPAANAFQR